jgi:hypothetical protein
LFKIRIAGYYLTGYTYSTAGAGAGGAGACLSGLGANRYFKEVVNLATDLMLENIIKLNYY